MNHIISKVLACMLVITLTCTNLILLGTYATNSYAAANELETQETLIKDKVEFDTYFLDGENKVHSKVVDINATDLKLYTSIEIKEGYLKNASIDMGDANFILKGVSETYEKIAKIEDNIITLNEISAGEKYIFELEIEINKPDKMNVSNFSRENSAKIKGTLVTGETGITGKEKNVSIENTIKVKLDLHGEAVAILEKGNTKYAIYNTSENSGIILQTVIKTGLQNNNIPIKSTILEFGVPTINNSNPNKITVSANSLKATVGDEKVNSFTDENWKYYEEEQKISITVTNEVNENNEVTWAKQGLDEYIITYVYEGQILPEDKNLMLKANLNIEAYNNEETRISLVDENITTLEEHVGNIATFEVEATNTLPKGYMYHSPESELEYQTKWTANLGYVNIIDDIELHTEGDVLKSEDNSIAVSGLTYYKSTVISKSNFTKILGDVDDAYIEIWNPNTSSNEPIVRIDKNTEVNEENNIVVNYDAGIDNIFVVTSKPVKEGSLEISHNKVIKANSLYQKYDKTSILSLTKLETKLNGSVINNGQILVGENVLQKDIALIEPQTKIEATIDNANLSTVVTNENVNLKIVLKSNDVTTDLYKNPVIEMVLPSYIEQMVINKIDLLHEEELGQPVVTTTTNEAGNSVLIISMQGEQTKYHTDKSTEGATIAIDANITVKRLTPSLTDKIEIYVTNENAVSYENSVNGKGYKEVEVNFKAPIGMVTVNSISGHNGEEKVTSINSQEQLGKLPINSPAKIAKIDFSIINNYEETCENVNILGRLPAKGNKSIDGQELGNSMTLKLLSPITAVSGVSVENVKVYYSDNGEATNDLNNPENRWTDRVEELSNAKSYLIVLSNYQMQKGSMLEFSYNVEVPANLKHNQTAYTIYNVYFTKGAEREEVNTSAKVGLSTMEGPELNVSLKANVEEGQILQEGQRITYKMEIKNTGDIEAKDLKVIGYIPENTIYTKYIPADTDGYGPERYDNYPEIKQYEETIESIKPGETKTVEYIVQIDTIKGEEQTISAVGKVTVDSNDVYTTNVIENKVKKGSIILELICGQQKLAEQQEFTYNVVIRNANSETKTNVKMTNQIPEGLSFVDVQAYKDEINDTVNASFNEATNTVVYNIETLKPREEVKVLITVKTNKLGAEELEKEIVNIVKATSNQNNKEILSNEVTIVINKPKLEIKQESNIAPGNINVGDKLTYNIEVKNVGTGAANNVTVIDCIPEGLRYISTEYTIGETTMKSTVGTNEIKVSASIEVGQILYIKINVIAEELEEGQSQKEVTNIVKVSSKTIDEIEANKITHIINSNKQSSSAEESVEEILTYKITGNVWQDNNEDGKRDDEEPTLNGITVKLVNSKTAKKVAETITDANGKYEFVNLEKDRYIVVFMYESQEYMVTTYQAEGVNESRNSDAIENAITIEGEVVEGAITNNINLTSGSIYNVDLGLILRNKFDLSLSKTINKVTVKTTKGTENYTYDEGATFAKIDIAPKRIEGASVVIEYKIAVKNNGTIEGFASKIVDYLPKELKFSSELNPDWYESEDGSICSTVLADSPLNPGEEQELTLVLTKTMTGENTGIVHNTAEIAEEYNVLGLTDINSVPANKLQNENDMGSADVMITVNTGEPAMYVTLTISMLALFAVGAYLINKKVLMI